MKDSWFKIEFANQSQKDYYDSVGHSTFIYPLEPYRGLTSFSEVAYITSAIRRYRCSLEEARDKFYRILQDRDYEELTEMSRWGYEDAMDMLDYEARSKNKIPIRRV